MRKIRDNLFFQLIQNSYQLKFIKKLDNAWRDTVAKAIYDDLLLIVIKVSPTRDFVQQITYAIPGSMSNVTTYAELVEPSPIRHSERCTYALSPMLRQTIYD